ncbi:putative aminohydrolase SsnA [Loigolactobacillus coryniformis]|jgi:putative selenium metabolism protein SsnA|uniref:putative aminohydrolase SsnA n=1 Tax=Loigolactobacillus coryniformis TaxID=1610 RepID=UPI001C5FBA9A|nr:putative aminohydrolase SsnA [Loigolactobacillus coryniformis]MBW4801982.1 putative aminohydrolase SsnA [Loigolactobacillus coryniformis subsp. torquens]MBW4804696.1 putative aminohydrolase SsnA [Loigolactobacillus coryniformis subsp. torquens]MDT3392576.1 putative aminohydrolase SsnA [Bacillota bacterium]
MLLIGNGNLITRQQENDFIKDGCVAIDGKLIKEVGTTTALKAKYPAAEFIDAKGGLIMPGLVNMHNHIYSTFARGLSINGYHPKNFMDILVGQWFRLDRELDNAATYASGKVAYLDSIKNGVTTMFDHHASYGEIGGSLGELSRAADELGVRTCLCYEVSDRNGEAQMKAAVAENIDFINAAKQRDDDMQHAMMGLHAAFTLSDDTLAYVKAQTPTGTGYHIHIAEGMADVQDSLAKYNKPIVNRLFDWGILGKQTMAGHCIHIGPHEMEILRDTDTMVVTNPESNMGNAVGCPAALKMFNDYHILIGLGTDGYTNDLLESYKFGNLIHKHHLADPNAGWTEIPAMLFNNNPQMANRLFKTKLGVLDAGAAADVIVVDYQAPTPITADNYNSHILFGVNGRMVNDTIINGQVRMRNREVVGVDEAKIWADAQEQAQHLWQRING